MCDCHSLIAAHLNNLHRPGKAGLEPPVGIKVVCKQHFKCARQLAFKKYSGADNVERLPKTWAIRGGGFKRTSQHMKDSFFDPDDVTSFKDLDKAEFLTRKAKKLA